MLHITSQNNSDCGYSENWREYLIEVDTFSLSISLDHQFFMISYHLIIAIVFIDPFASYDFPTFWKFIQFLSLVLMQGFEFFMHCCLDLLDPNLFFLGNCTLRTQDIQTHARKNSQFMSLNQSLLTFGILYYIMSFICSIKCSMKYISVRLD